MKGTILSYDKDTHKGFISGYDGTRSTFTKQYIPNAKKIKDGMEVDFENEDKNAKDIVILKPEKEGSTAMAIWAFVLGILLIILTMISSGDQRIDNAEMGGVLFWTFVITILSLRVLFTSRPGKWMAVTGLVLAALSFLGALGIGSGG